MQWITLIRVVFKSNYIHIMGGSSHWYQCFRGLKPRAGTRGNHALSSEPRPASEKIKIMLSVYCDSKEK